MNLDFGNKEPLPSEFSDLDIRYSEELVEFFVRELTKKHHTVYDPFTGYGTTLKVAKEMGRRVIGTEIDKQKFEYLNNFFEMDSEIYYQDAQTFLESNPVKFDFVMTSPPYMSNLESKNPLTNYQTSASYSEYIKGIGVIFEFITSNLTRDAFVVIEVANLKNKGGVTRLAWDIGTEVSKILNFQGEIIVQWEAENKENGTYGYGYDHSYCLVYQNQNLS